MYSPKSSSYSHLSVTRNTTVTNQSSSYYSYRSSSQLNQKSFDLSSTLPDTSLQNLQANRVRPARYQPPISISPQKGRYPKEEDSTTIEIKKYHLTKIVINRMFNVRSALQKFKDIPVSLFKQSQDFQLARELLFKNKLNPQTSVLRTLIFAEESGAAPAQKKCFAPTRGVFVLPTQIQKDKGKEKVAIVQLSYLLKGSIQQCVRKFKANLEAVRCKERYFARMCATYESNHQEAFERMRWLPDLRGREQTRNKVEVMLLKMVWRGWQQRYDNHTRQFFNNLTWYAEQVRIQKTNVAKNIVTFSKLRREQMFRHWLNLAKMPLPKPKPKTFEITEEKKQILERIVLRSYIKVLKQVARKKAVFREVAGRLALHSKINEQKALWRMMAYMQQWR